MHNAREYASFSNADNIVINTQEDLPVSWKVTNDNNLFWLACIPSLMSKDKEFDEQLRGDSHEDNYDDFGCCGYDYDGDDRDAVGGGHDGVVDQPLVVAAASGRYHGKMVGSTGQNEEDDDHDIIMSHSDDHSDDDNEYVSRHPEPVNLCACPVSVQEETHASL